MCAVVQLMEPNVTDIRFSPIRRNGSHVGYCSFLFERKFAFKRVAVHEKLNKSGYRLNYENKEGEPTAYPITKEIGELIEKDVSAFLKANAFLK